MRLLISFLLIFSAPVTGFAVSSTYDAHSDTTFVGPFTGRSLTGDCEAARNEANGKADDYCEAVSANYVCSEPEEITLVEEAGRCGVQVQVTIERSRPLFE